MIINMLIEVIRKVSSGMREYADKEMVYEDFTELTMKQLFYLEFIYKHTKATVSDLAVEFNVTKPTITTAVNKLIKDNYVYKVQNDNDRRMYNLFITKKGKKMLQANEEARRVFAGRIIRSLSDKEVQQLKTICQKILDM